MKHTGNYNVTDVQEPSGSNTPTVLNFWKNYLLICFSMLFFYIAATGISSIQSTVLKESGLGLASSTVIFTTFGLSGLIIPQMLISFIKLKWTMTLGFSLTIIYVGLNCYPEWYSYMIASVLRGIGQATVFTCAGIGVNELSKLRAITTNTNPINIQGLFFGIFGIFLQTAGALGQLISALVFERKFSYGSNSTFNYSTCGKNFCPDTQLPPAAYPSIYKIYTIVAVYGTCTIISVVLSLFLDEINSINKENSKSMMRIVKHQLKEIRKQFFQTNQFLAMWMNIMNSYILTFLWADFTRSFAACSSGLDYIGWSSMVLYGASAIFSPVFGKIASMITLIPVFVTYYALIIGTSLYMLFWQSDPQTLWNLFLLAILLGVIESINTPQPRALYGLIFDTEVVYSSFTFFQGIGFLIGFMVTTFFCTYIKIYLLLAFCGVSIVTGTIIFVINKKKIIS